MLSNVKILKKKFSFSSRNSRFWKKFSFTSRKNEILQTDSLSLLDSSLNVFSNSREKSYFALWVDFDHQCFAERESILKRQFCVVEQYSDFSLQKHFMETTTTKSLLWEGMNAQWKGYNKMDNHCTDRLMIIALWWWYCQTHNLYSGIGHQNSSLWQRYFFVFRTEEK